jgi:hypothetical protein
MSKDFSADVIQAAATIVASKIAADAAAGRPELPYTDIPTHMSLAIGAVLAGIEMAKKLGKGRR